jgi:hypothetical protein
MRLACCCAAAGLFLVCTAGCSKPAASKPANAPAATDEKPLQMTSPADKTRSRKAGGFQQGN